MKIICASKEQIANNLAIRSVGNTIEIVRKAKNIPFKNTVKWDDVETVDTILVIHFEKQESINNIINALNEIKL